MMGKQMLGDYYLKQLVEVNKATITRYETHISMVMLCSTWQVI